MGELAPPCRDHGLGVGREEALWRQVAKQRGRLIDPPEPQRGGQKMATHGGVVAKARELLQRRVGLEHLACAARRVRPCPQDSGGREEAIARDLERRRARVQGLGEEPLDRRVGRRLAALTRTKESLDFPLEGDPRFVEAFVSLLESLASPVARGRPPRRHLERGVARIEGHRHLGTGSGRSNEQAEADQNEQGAGVATHARGVPLRRGGVAACAARGRAQNGGVLVPYLAALLAGSAPADGTFVSLRMTGGFTPYRLVHWEVLWRKRVAVANHYCALVNVDEALTDMRLVPTDEFEALLAGLLGDGALELRDAPAPKVHVGAQTFEVELVIDGRSNVFKVTEPEAQDDPTYARVVDRIERFVTDAVGPMPFKNAFFDAGAFGFLNITAVPVSRLFVDGRDTGLDTPVYGYELPKGSHVLRLVGEAGEREHTVKIEGGMTTILHMDLR